MSVPTQDRKPFREWRKRQAYRVLPFFPPFGYLFIRALGSSLRVRFSGSAAARDLVDSGRPIVLAFFHGRQFLLAHELRNRPIVIMTSISYMGEIQSRILQRLGYQTIKGSSSRGGARVLGEMLGRLRKGKIGAFAVDGPRGPFQEVKPGAVFAAKKLGIPLVPVTTSACPGLVLRLVWDRYLVPMPFSRAILHFGHPLDLSADLSEHAVSQDCLRLGKILNQLEGEADALTGRDSP